MAMINYDLIPESTKDAIDNWVALGRQPGHFVAAVLANDLFEAVGRADSFNILALHSICGYVYNEIPSTAWGSAEKMEAWRQRFVENQQEVER